MATTLAIGAPLAPPSHHTMQSRGSAVPSGNRCLTRGRAEPRVRALNASTSRSAARKECQVTRTAGQATPRWRIDGATRRGTAGVWGIDDQCRPTAPRAPTGTDALTARASAEPRGRRMSVCAGVWAPLWSTATVGDRHRDYGAATGGGASGGGCPLPCTAAHQRSRGASPRLGQRAVQSGSCRDRHPAARAHRPIH